MIRQRLEGHGYEIRVRFERAPHMWCLWEVGVQRETARLTAAGLLSYESRRFGRVIEVKAVQIGTDKIIAHQTAPPSQEEG